MGGQIKNNFDKRFGDRVRIVYSKKSSTSEKKLHYGKLYQAIIKLLSSILGREPTQKELLGMEDISKKKRTK